MKKSHSTSSRTASTIIAAHEAASADLTYQRFHTTATKAIEQFVTAHYDVSNGDALKDPRTGKVDQMKLFIFNELKHELANIAIGVAMGIPDRAGLEASAGQFLEHSNAKGINHAAELANSLQAALEPLAQQVIAQQRSTESTRSR